MAAPKREEITPTGNDGSPEPSYGCQGVNGAAGTARSPPAFSRQTKEDPMDAIPSSIHEGMIVYDSNLESIGKVETFRITDEAPDNPNIDAAGVSPVLEDERDTLTSILADVFRGEDDLPREMQEKALRDGFVRLDADGLFASDRYIFPEHIDRVDADRLVLNVPKERLLKA
jgi:hypothetical protein